MITRNWLGHSKDGDRASVDNEQRKGREKGGRVEAGYDGGNSRVVARSVATQCAHKIRESGRNPGARGMRV